MSTDYEMSYLVDRIYSKITPDEKKKIDLTRPKVSKLPRKTYIENFSLICSQINRNKNDVMAYYEQELLTKEISINDAGGLIIRGMFKSSSIEKLLKEYIVKFVLCSVCKSYDTNIVKIDKIKYIQCQCGSRNAIAN